jgi:subtilisin family serine protease
MNESSMATPHIAGLAALLWQAYPQATVDQVEAAIHRSCTRPSTMLKDRANRGIPDAVKALAELQKATISGTKKATSVKKKSTKKKSTKKKSTKKKATTSKKATASKKATKKTKAKKKK